LIIQFAIISPFYSLNAWILENVFLIGYKRDKGVCPWVEKKGLNKPISLISQKNDDSLDDIVLFVSVQIAHR